MARSMANRCRPRKRGNRNGPGTGTPLPPFSRLPLGLAGCHPGGSGEDCTRWSQFRLVLLNHRAVLRRTIIEHDPISRDRRSSYRWAPGGERRRAGALMAAEPASSHWRNRPAAVRGLSVRRSPYPPFQAYLLSAGGYAVVHVPDARGTHAIVPDGADPSEVARAAIATVLGIEPNDVVVAISSAPDLVASAADPFVPRPP